MQFICARIINPVYTFVYAFICYEQRCKVVSIDPIKLFAESVLHTVILRCSHFSRPY